MANPTTLLHDTYRARVSALATDLFCVFDGTGS